MGPNQLEQRSCLKPWYVTDARIDLRPGGEFSSVMNGPNREGFDNAGAFLKIESFIRLVTTGATLLGWLPFEGPSWWPRCSSKVVAMEGRTTRSVQCNWDEAELTDHENMGSHEGWSKASDPLEALAMTL